MYLSMNPSIYLSMYLSGDGKKSFTFWQTQQRRCSTQERGQPGIMADPSKRGCLRARTVIGAWQIWVCHGLPINGKIPKWMVSYAEMLIFGSDHMVCPGFEGVAGLLTVPAIIVRWTCHKSYVVRQCEDHKYIFSCLGTAKGRPLQNQIYNSWFSRLYN